MAKKAQRLFIANEDNIVRLKENYPDSLLLGESSILPEDFFDANNCTDNIGALALANKTVLYMSNNGSRTIELAFAKKAKQVVATSFTNICTVLDWLQKKQEQTVFLIPSGDKQFADRKVAEDSLCANTIVDLLQGKLVKWETIFGDAKQYIKNHYSDFSEKETAMQLAVDTYPVLPFCIREKDGVVRIINKQAE